MKDTRKSIKVIAGVKYELEVMKRQLGLKSESEAILYLKEFYDLHRSRLTLDNHNEFKQRVQHLHRQQSI
ncbi:hypothetical protein D3C84_1246510 [compost metagenome]